MMDIFSLRLQSKQGFLAAGGFRNIYSGASKQFSSSIKIKSLLAGLGPAAVGSAPNAAIFFCTYDTVKRMAVQKLGYQVLLSEAEDFLY